LTRAEHPDACLSRKRSADLGDATKHESFADNSANAENSAVFFVVSVNISESYTWSPHCNSVSLFTLQKSQMTLKIEKVADGRKTVIRRSGRLRSEHLDELKTQIDGDQSRIELDLDGVTLVGVEAVRFLNACEESGVDLLHCWPYIREWMIREKGREG
jgi:hypothetical protein